MKNLLAVLVGALLVITFSIDASACNHRNCTHYTWVDDDSIDVDNSNDNSNSNNNVFRPTNNNSNTNINTNINTLKNDQKQGQEQDQLQLQGQGQGQGQMQKSTAKQSQSADNKGNKQSIIINGDTYEDKRELISAPQAPVTKVDPTDHEQTQAIKTLGSLFARSSGLTLVSASTIAKIAGDYEIKMAIMETGTSQVRSKTSLMMKTSEKMVENKASMKFMGYIYALPTGDDVTLPSMEAGAAKAAMEAGATHFFYTVSIGKYLEGSSVNIGIGGGASMFAAGGAMGIAPSGGFGWGKAWTNNELRPAVMVTCFRDDTVSKLISTDGAVKVSSIEQYAKVYTEGR